MQQSLECDLIGGRSLLRFPALYEQILCFPMEEDEDFCLGGIELPVGGTSTESLNSEVAPPESESEVGNNSTDEHLSLPLVGISVVTGPELCSPYTKTHEGMYLVC